MTRFMPLREGPYLLLAKVPDRIGRIGIFFLFVWTKIDLKEGADLSL